MTDLRQIQQIELEMLRTVKHVCEKNDIPYYLAQGTLLGAVRHQDFIPWDDDADVLVPLEEIDRFVTCFQAEKDPRHFVTNRHIEEYYPMSWTKIRRLGTTSMPRQYQQIPVNWGICIDIFHYFGLSNHKILQKGEIFAFKTARKLLMATMAVYDEQKSLSTRLLCHLPLATRRRLADWFFRLAYRHKGEKTTDVYVTCKGGKVLRRGLLESPEPVYGSFAGENFRIPADADGFLTLMFGDYMTPPPEAERGGHELRMGDIVWDCDVGYEMHRGK